MNTHCPECGNPIREGEPTVFVASEQATFHEECAEVEPQGGES